VGCGFADFVWATTLPPKASALDVRTGCAAQHAAINHNFHVTFAAQRIGGPGSAHPYNICARVLQKEWYI
jgi:hypothetical protein